MGDGHTVQYVYASLLKNKQVQRDCVTVKSFPVITSARHQVHRDPAS